MNVRNLVLLCWYGKISKLYRKTGDYIRVKMNEQDKILDEITGKQLIRYGHVERIDPTRLPKIMINPYPTAFPYGNGMALHFYQQQESSTTKTVHKVINKGLKAYV